jgi:hypothetical protein
LSKAPGTFVQFVIGGVIKQSFGLPVLKLSWRLGLNLLAYARQIGARVGCDQAQKGAKDQGSGHQSMISVTWSSVHGPGRQPPRMSHGEAASTPPWTAEKVIRVRRCVARGCPGDASSTADDSPGSPRGGDMISRTSLASPTLRSLRRHLRAIPTLFPQSEEMKAFARL